MAITKSKKVLGQINSTGTSFTSRPGIFSRSSVLYALFSVLVAGNVALGISLFMSPEISTLFGNQDRYAYQAYQERILQLRMEVDRLHSRQYLQSGNFNLKLQELMQQQQILSEQQQYIRILAQKAQELGIVTAAGEADVGPVASIETVSSNAVIGNTPAAGVPDFEFLSQSVDQMFSESRTALSAISEAADQSTSDIVKELQGVGLSLDLPSEQDLAVGGPLLPPREGQQNPGIAQRANAVLLSLERFQYARSALTDLPVRHPLATSRRISSYFGNRPDPFGGNSAFHSGIDYPSPTGTPVFAAGAGEVIWSGRRNGYGIMVEIKHENGLVTRYAHLSATLVQKGQMVDAASLIAKVGSTGRSTGPHLHFEVRKDASPVNPANYLRIAERLSNYLT